MCIITNNTVHNCKTKTIHCLYHNDYMTSMNKFENEETDKNIDNSAFFNDILNDNNTNSERNTVFKRIIYAMKIRYDQPVLSCIINNKIRDYTGKEIINMINKMRIFWKYLFTKIGKDLKIGIYLDTSLPYILTDLSLQSFNIPSISIYSTHGKEALDQIIKEHNIDFIVMEESVYKSNIFNQYDLSVLLCNRNMSQSEKENKNTNVYYLNDVLNDQYKNKNDCEYIHDKQNNTVTIMYTSGTTSDIPKKIEITNDNLLSMIDSFIYGVEKGLFKDVEFMLKGNKNVYSLKNDHHFNGIDHFLQLNDFSILNNNTVHLSYLPLSHILERLLSYLLVSLGVKLVYYRGNKKNIKEDFKLVKPDMLVGAPRVFEHIENMVMNKKISNWGVKVKKKISEIKESIKWHNKGYNTSISYFNSFIQLYHQYVILPILNIFLFILNMIIFKYIRRQFGNKVKFIFCGGAFLSNKLKYLMEKIIFDCVFYEVYGMTESSGVVSVNTCNDNENIYNKDDSIHNNNGYPLFPLECVIFKNELLIRGLNVGKESEIDEKELDKEKQRVFQDNLRTGIVNWTNSNEHSEERGNNHNICAIAPKYGNLKWYRTGDLAILKNGNIFITGRMNDNFKTSLGEFIVPERIERIIKDNSNINEIVVVGKMDKSYLVGLVYFVNDCNCSVKNDDVDHSKNINLINCKECTQSNYQYCMSIFNSLKESSSLFSYELPKKILFLNKSIYTIKNCYVESTLKLRRNGVMKVFQKEIDDLYEE